MTKNNCSTCKWLNQEFPGNPIWRDSVKGYLYIGVELHEKFPEDPEEIALNFCPECGTKIECYYCGGSGKVTRDYHDPGDAHGHGQTEEICICRLGDEDADMDDDS